MSAWEALSRWDFTCPICGKVAELRGVTVTVGQDEEGAVLDRVDACGDHEDKPGVESPDAAQ